jgi:lipoprotein-releasing system permease protein
LSIVIKGIVAGNIIALVLLYLQKCFRIIPLDPVNYFVNHIPVHVDFLKLIAIDLVSLLVIAIILYIPARFISSVEPDKSLRQK